MRVRVNCIDEVKYGVCEDVYVEILRGLSDQEVEEFNALLPLIPLPASNSSVEAGVEIQQLVALQNTQRSKMIDTIQIIDRDLISPFVTACDQLKINPQLKMIEQIIEYGQKIALFFKVHFNRARPFQIALFHTTEFAPMASISAWTPSYPSGHAIQAEMLCKMYCGIYPEHSETWKSISKLISHTRMVGGYHYQSDIDCSIHIVNLIWSSNVKTN